MNPTRSRVAVVAILTVGLWATAVAPAHAYIDPGSGSLIIQVIVGFFAAIGAGLVVFREKVRGMFSRKPKGPNQLKREE